MRHPEKNIETVAAFPRLLTRPKFSRCSVHLHDRSPGCARASFPCPSSSGRRADEARRSRGWPTRSTPGLLPGPGGSSPPRRSSPAINQRSGGVRRSVLDAWMSAHDHSPDNRARSNSQRPPAGHLLTAEDHEVNEDRSSFIPNCSSSCKVSGQAVSTARSRHARRNKWITRGGQRYRYPHGDCYLLQE